MHADRLGALARVDLVGAPLECHGEVAEGGVEHRAHDQLERPALELVGDEEFHFAGGLARGAKAPAIVHALEWAFEIFDQNFEAVELSRRITGEDGPLYFILTKA